MQIEKETRLFLLSLLLLLLILLVFDQVRNFDFIHYDDDTYVLGNRKVQAGLTASSIAWAFTATEAGFWHPLTWLSLMVDHEIYGLNAGGYHGTNMIFHMVNTLLLFLVFVTMTGAVWRSAVVAVLFAIHPLHVESVAWIAERKDVLSTSFLFLALGTYIAYVKRPAVTRYLLVLLAFSLGLMAKPMLVTLPCMLVLLDFWPLGRIRLFGVDGIARERLVPLPSLSRVLWEKVPLMLLALGAGALVFYTERRVGALASLDYFPLTLRISHVLVSYMLYLGKTFWPIDLAVFYPHPGQWPLLIVSIAAVSLCAITLVCIRLISRCPYAMVGWSWYLGTLVPVIGFVQLGTQGMADRYTYIPLIGIFIMIAWGMPDLLQRWPRKAVCLAPATLLILAILGYQAWRQTGLWQDAKTLFQHAVVVTRGNYLAHNNLGAALAREGEIEAALEQYREALRLLPRYPDALFNMGQALDASGRFAEAKERYREALQIRPTFVEAHNNLGIILANEGNKDEAAHHFTAALRHRPDYQAAANNLNILLREREKP